MADRTDESIPTWGSPAYGPAQHLYTRRGYVLNGTGAWAGAEPVRGGDVLVADDALVLYLTKQLGGRRTRRTRSRQFRRSTFGPVGS